MKEFDEPWRRWIERNVQEGCSKDLLFKILHDAGFGFDDIRRELAHEPEIPLRVIFGPTSVWEGALQEGAAGGGGRDFSDWLDTGPSIECPEWIRKATLEQQARVPFLDAGGPECRGFEKRRMDEEIFAEVAGVFDASRHRFEHEETDAIGGFLGTVSEDLPPTLLYAPHEFKAVLLDLMKPLHEAWCGFELEPVACYGFRVYLHGAYLHEHVDRQDSHVVSSSLCVARELYAPWPLTAEDVDGGRHELDLEPGEFILYESGRIAHGRPIPMNGRHHVGLFLHYRPAHGWETWVESPKAWWAEYGPSLTR